MIIFPVRQTQLLYDHYIRARARAYVAELVCRVIVYISKLPEGVRKMDL